MDVQAPTGLQLMARPWAIKPYPGDNKVVTMQNIQLARASRPETVHIQIGKPVSNAKGKRRLIPGGKLRTTSCASLHPLFGNRGGCLAKDSLNHQGNPQVLLATAGLRVAPPLSSGAVATRRAAGWRSAAIGVEVCNIIIVWFGPARSGWQFVRIRLVDRRFCLQRAKVRGWDRDARSPNLDEPP